MIISHQPALTHEFLHSNGPCFMLADIAAGLIGEASGSGGPASLVIPQVFASSKTMEFIAMINDGNGW